MEMIITIQQVFLRDGIPPTTQKHSGKVIKDCLQLSYQYTSLPDQGHILGVVIITLQLLNTFYLSSSLAKVWKPFVKTNISLYLIWHWKMALTDLSTTMFASCYGSSIHTSKCCNIVGCHSEVLYDSIISFERVVCSHTCIIFIEKHNGRPTEAGLSMYSFIRQ